MPVAKRPLCYLIAAATVLLAACGATPTPAPAPTPAPPIVLTVEIATPAAPAAPTQPAAEDDWKRIQAAGKIRVGTSADYPPFAYYAPNYTLDGFDIALMTELARRMGIAVEFTDFAFDGLGGALQLRQVDAAIAAISVTPERQAVVDFSNVYYVGENGVLALGNSPIKAVNAAADMVGHRIGVQQGTVHETWIKRNLVDTGQVPAGDVLSYIDTDTAVRDLKASRIDLVALDLLPAQQYVNTQGVKLVGEGLDKQRFAIAARKGSAGLLAQINRALTQAQNDGTVSRLIEQYLRIEQKDIPPTPAPAPEPTAEPQPQPTLAPPPCFDGMTLVQDLNYDDNGMTTPPALNPGQGFQKGWRLANTGTCDWTTSYALTFVAGNQSSARMEGQTTPIGRSVKPGETFDLFINLIAPAAPGVYQGIWQMRNGAGAAFGQKIWVGINVIGAPTQAPYPTQTPAPNIAFSANTTRIAAGQPVVFTWNAQNVSAVYFYPDGQDYHPYGVPGASSQTVYPAQTANYNLRVEKRDGSAEVRSILITVQPAVNAPQITQFTTTPSGSIVAGQCVNIAWTVQGQVSKVVLSRNGATIWDSAPVAGTTNDCPPGNTQSIQYILTATGPGGTSQQGRALTVILPTQIPPNAPTPVP